MSTTIDHKAIAEGLYEMFDEGEKTVLAFGMLPESKLSILRKQLKLKAKELFRGPEEIFSSEEMEEMSGVGLKVFGQQLADKKREEFVRDAEHEICLALYRVAPMVV
jgi:hypothetical protein